MSKDNTNTIVIASICGCCLIGAILFFLFFGGVFAFFYNAINTEYQSNELLLPEEDYYSPDYYYHLDDYDYDDYYDDYYYDDYYYDEDIFNNEFFDDLFDSYDYETAPEYESSPSAKLT